ncbi:S-adenosyl-L-methionine-dependent methyltransferase [Rhypophila decipiens]|uniref:S-adenosyl-L-methionine-dependent methyltransferase n=1 Tax=Rhypophila decipiens TaxID=261697 RepID=A0AAN6YB66_9PEZI|nr:S-adenosyl-L-methionine-dependent methyltransferase [Rhypophila decipiens]
MGTHTHQNKEFFNNEAANYDARHEKTLDQIIQEIRARLDFIGVDWVADDDDNDNEGEDGKPSSGKTVRLLDYACGTGVVSRALAPYTTQCVGIDLSENMVAAYNARAENQGLATEEMHAYQGNICDPEDPSPAALASPGFHNFDIAAVGLGFHHFDDPELAATRLAERLRPGGVLLILDFLPHGKFDTHHPAAHTVTHHGFSEDQIKGIFTKAGVGKDFALDEVSRDIKFNRPALADHNHDHGSSQMHRRLFLARGTKA